jgi:hypothetical protein
MKAKIKATGEILEILDIGVSGKYFYLSNDKKYSRNELEFLSETIDWQHYRIQASIAAMQGMVISDGYCSEEPVGPSYQIKRRKWPPARIAQEAVAYADFLIAELQKKGAQDENG